MQVRVSLLSAVAALAGLCGSAGAEFKTADHPFILWTKADLAAIRKRIDTEPWAKAVYEKLADNDDGLDRQLGDLLRCALTGDEKLRQAQIKELMRVVRSPIPRGGAQWLTVLRYDLLHDQLSAEQRDQFEAMARVYIDNAVFQNAVFNPKVFNDSRHYSRYDAREYTRSNWLPNIIWPRKVSANLLALALRDEELIRKTWAAYGSWKWYFDEYLCDIGFYSEEFSKMGSTPGAMLVYCIGAERLGLGELGFGYTGKAGATMRGHIASLIHLGYPRVDVCSDRPQYPIVTLGDLRQVGSSQGWNLPSPAFQHSLVTGYTPEGIGGTLRWRAHGAWGGTVRGNNPQWDGYSGFTPKMQAPLWFELGAVRWPQEGFAWFLAQMRGPEEKVYTPSLYFGLEPIDPAKVQPPAAPSAVWPQRGLVMLRAEPSPAYWSSPAPAVAMRLASNYAHHVNDSFALAGFYAFNRPIYINRQVWPGYAQGWSRSIQSHCGVRVDAAEPKFTDAVAIRHAFTPAVQFLAATSRDVYPGVELTRGLMLTREYLLDVARLAADEPHDYTWIVHALGVLQPTGSGRWRDGKLPAGLDALREVRELDAGDSPWSVAAVQTCALADASKAMLPRPWYDRKIGVTMRMLGEAGTTARTAQTPLPLSAARDSKGRTGYAEMPSEVGGVTIVAARRAPATTFAALHEPFQGGAGQIGEFRRIARSDEGLAVAVVGSRPSPIDDRAMLRLAGDAGRPLTLAGGGESFTFTDYAYLRVGAEKVEVSARSLTGMTLRVGDRRPKLIVNGKEIPARFEGGMMVYVSTP